MIEKNKRIVNQFNIKHEIVRERAVAFHKKARTLCRVQLLRSVSFWSAGFDKDEYENSIYNAYIHHIGDADYFIYMENQFFVSAYTTVDCPVKNRIAEALFNRILIAHKRREQFKVYLLTPLYPGIASRTISLFG